MLKNFATVAAAFLFNTLLMRNSNLFPFSCYISFKISALLKQDKSNDVTIKFANSLINIFCKNLLFFTEVAALNENREKAEKQIWNKQFFSAKKHVQQTFASLESRSITQVAMAKKIQRDRKKPTQFRKHDGDA